jgi:NAD(P)-dependent dehydrogenase (short-subunit alcohol dehydrogenase family)
MNIIVIGCSRGVVFYFCIVLLEQGNTVYGIARSYTDEFKALESEYVTQMIPGWIDIIWGYKVTGRAAQDAYNTYDPVLYPNTWMVKNQFIDADPLADSAEIPVEFVYLENE